MIFIDYIRRLPSHIVLSMGIFLFVYVFPLIDKPIHFELIGPLSYTIISLSVLSIIENKRQSKAKYLSVLIFISIVLIWVIHYSNLELLRILSFAFNIIVFMSATIIMIKQIVESKDVTPKVILEAINGYFLIGVMFTLTNTLIWGFNHESIGIGEPEIVNFVYYSFITLTTIGYGDIAPVSDFAKITSVFFGISAQLYLTIIMALIIGKYLNQKNN